MSRTRRTDHDPQIDWRPTGHQQVLELDWEQFDDLMRERGRKRRKDYVLLSWHEPGPIHVDAAARRRTALHALDVLVMAPPPT